MVSRTWLQTPYLRLTILFGTYKIILLVIALLSPGPGYDTSTVLQLRNASGKSEDEIQGVDFVSLFTRQLAIKLTRWDALYYTKIADRGYLFEQEWAFGFGFTRLVAFTAKRTVRN